jgi:large subunit ribosomal protein L6
MKHQIHHTFEIKIPNNVTITKEKNILFFSGPLGSTSINLQKIDPLGSTAIHLDTENFSLKILSSSKSYSGLIKKLILNKIQGIVHGFLIYLKIIGIGYRAQLEKNTLFLKLGYSHDIIYNIPSSIKIFLIDPTVICLFGVDKNQLTQIASKLRSLRKPSAYKGKGIRFIDEKIKIKAGKRK